MDLAAASRSLPFCGSGLAKWLVLAAGGFQNEFFPID
jgi:hypothetical protein